MTLDVLFNKCNKLMPRYYTISSSSKVHPQDLHIAVSLSETTFKSGDSKMGQVSAFLKQYAGEGKSMARIFTKTSTFIMPADPATPYIMCGPGTGVVPFLGFMQERAL
jgi:NADPH-ferrihemoprotein reductase